MRITNNMVASVFEGDLTMSIISGLVAVWFIISDPVAWMESFARSVAGLGVEARRDVKGEYERNLGRRFCFLGLGTNLRVFFFSVIVQKLFACRTAFQPAVCLCFGLYHTCLCCFLRCIIYEMILNDIFNHPKARLIVAGWHGGV